MKKYIINGGKKLYGKVEVERAKNAFLPILAGCILCNGIVTLHKVPNFVDIHNMLKILEHIGVKVEWQGDTLKLDCTELYNHDISHELAHPIRSSIFTLGALIGRLGKAKMSYPGGCDIGLRPINLHLKGLRDLGVKIIEKHGYIYSNANEIVGKRVFLDFPSVGATENIIMASVLAKGKTQIFNCAREPEIVDLQNFLNLAGAKISGAGTNTITIEGVDNLNSVEYTPMPDRIIAGTYLIACAICGGEVEVVGAVPQHNEFLLNYLNFAGCKIKTTETSVTISSNKQLLAIPTIETMPYPAFPTDLQPQMAVMQTVSQGTSVITENLFETRSKHFAELKKMGANIVVNNRVAIINGVPTLYGATVKATDLRAGAGLVLAGLVAEGYSTIENIEHILRGYQDFDTKLKALGADIEVVEE